MENQESEFQSKMAEIAGQAIELTVTGLKRCVIIIATEQDDEITRAVIAVSGSSKDLSTGIAEFATRDETKSILASGLKKAHHKMMLSAIEGVINKS